MTGSHRRFVVFDVETTGLSLGLGARIIEIGAVSVEHHAISGTFQRLINPGVPVPGAVTRIHGITASMLANQPRPEEVFPAFAQFIKGAVLVAHNAPFDVSFLRSELARIGMALHAPCRCTLKMSRRLLPHLPNHRLETVATYLLGPLPEDLQLHRALADAHITARIWLALTA